jgi:hypothetical protein
MLLNHLKTAGVYVMFEIICFIFVNIEDSLNFTIGISLCSGIIFGKT